MPQKMLETEKKDLEIERIPAAEVKKRDDKPVHLEKLNYDERTVDRLRKEIFAGYKRLQEERDSNRFDSKLDTLDAQYAGEMDDDAGLEFTLNVPITQVKVDALSRLALKAFLESDPKFSITPRPAFAKKDQWNVVVNRQSDYLDYKLDEEIDVESPLRKVLHQAALYPVGILKMSYEYCKKLRRREEFYSGRVEVMEDGKNLYQPGLTAFLKQYPEATQPGKDGHREYQDLLARKDVYFKAKFNEIVYDDPNPTFVDIRDFFVPFSCEGYIGLCNERLYIERQRYTWWELKKAEQNGDFENVDACKSRVSEDENKPVQKEIGVDGDYRTWSYSVLEVTYWFNEAVDSADPDKSSDDPESEVRIKCWFDVQSKTFLGAILYPYDAVDSDYIPFYVEDKKAGFYKGEFAAKLTSSHLAQNAALNLMLTEAWQQLMTTPIVRAGSPIADQFLNKRWKPGVPLEVPVGTLQLSEELDFLDRPQRMAGQAMLPILIYLAKQDDDRTGISSLTTGKESPTDPTAPAAKTAMLLQQSGINVSDYINCLLPSFNRIGEIILQLTYQMSKKSKSYRLRQMQGKVVGGEIFGEISRDDMIAKTNIQSRAAGFDFDKLNEKRENLALFQLLYPILSQTGLGSPEGIYTLARTLVQTWSHTWKNKVDTIMPDPRTFQESQFKICVQALAVYMKQIQAQSKVTGVPAQPDIREFLTMSAQMMKQAVAMPETKGAQ